MKYKSKLPFWLESLVGVTFSLLVYIPLVNSYFAHDEWTTFFKYYELNNLSLIESIKWFFIPRAGQFTPLSESISYLVFRFLGINYYAYFWIGLILHGIVGYLLIYLLLKLTKNKYLSIIGGIFFVIAPHHFQATSWVMANIGYAGSAIFLLLGLRFYFDWVTSGKYKNAFFASLLFLTSLLFKEITIFIFLAIPVITFIWTKKFKTSFNSILISLPGFIFIIWHYLYIKTHPLSDFSTSGSVSLVSAVSLPLRALVESIFPQHFIYFISKIILFIIPPISIAKLSTTAFNQMVESVGSGLVVVLVSIAIFTLLIKFYKKFYISKNNYFSLFTTGIILAAFSGAPYLFVDTINFSLLQPRYVYIGVLMITISLVPILEIAFKKFGRKVLLLVGIILAAMFTATIMMSKENSDANIVRKNIIFQVASYVKPGMDQTVLFVRSDTSFYGMPDTVKILPFQVGAGKLFAVYLHDKVYIPKQLYEIEVLGKLESQGYYSDKGGGFGYFRDFDELRNAVQKNKIKSEWIYAFEYNHTTNMITNITEEILKELFPNLNGNKMRVKGIQPAKY